MNRPVTCVIALLVALAGLIYLLSQRNQAADPETTAIVVHCAASFQEPIREIARRYEQEYGTSVRLNFAGSGVLESQIQVAGGDLFIPADVSYINRAREAGWLMESTPMTEMHAVIVVQKGNPRNITTLDDLARPGIRISVGEPSAAIGRYVRKMLNASGDWRKILPRIVVTKPTVNNVVEDVAIGAVDAGLAWDAVAAQFEEVEMVKVPIFEAKPCEASVGVIRGAKAPASLHFMRYLCARDKGLPVFGKMGFTLPEKNDHWADVPRLVVLAGAMHRPVLEQHIKQFENREGCRVDLKFESCDALAGLISKGEVSPSAYLGCDSSCLTPFQELFGRSQILTSNEIILFVAKGNPKRIRRLDDLLENNVRVGLADGRKNALGMLSMAMMKRYGVWQDLELSDNIELLADNESELLDGLLTGKLDAVLVYRSSVLASPAAGSHGEVIHLRQPDAIASQPFAITKATPYPQMMLRFRDFITKDDSRKRYEELGFIWKHQETNNDE